MQPEPSGGARAGTATGPQSGPMSIGAVLRALRAEFPELTVAGIRFLEAEGLVEPARSPSGGRRFREADVERLGRVLRLQRDHCLSLRAIKERLGAPGEAAPPPVVPVAAPRRAESEAPVPGSGEAPAASAVRTGRRELLGSAGVREEELAEWEEYGLLGPAGDGTYRLVDVAVARLVARLGRHGVEARHLRPVKAAADRQLALAEQRVAPLRRHPDQRTRSGAQSTADELADLSVRLYGAFMASGAHPDRTRCD
ncbi:MerR family transcriptional regulator [Streptomyces qinglanensis]|uniref:MerR HTH family regulatory protein n=1 Tax=Streptomyces qinglanensis TaxID=943816 RepID=A0A1H9RHB9_9ACTN|nr:MerR family transcriptional regulator [Streptomyces qinglanensis]SER72146.1 MerR HTH family regulatory protein [Streptomyces qinglanensis]